MSRQTVGPRVPCTVCGDAAYVSGTGTHRSARCPSCGLEFVTPPFDEEAGIALQREGVVIDDSGRSASFDMIESGMRERLGVPGAVLDVGCGAGAFLLTLRERGWSATGIDINSRAVEIAQSRGIDSRVARLADLAPSETLYDAVVLLNALEYFAQPLDALSRVAELLRPGGLIVLETPNTLYHRRQSTIGRLLRLPRSRLMTVEPLRGRRLVAFGPNSVRLALETAGFRNIVLEPAMPRAAGGPLEQRMRALVFASARVLAAASRGRIFLPPSMIVFATRA